MTRRRALALSFLTGAVALSSEILWYRAFSLGLRGRAQALGILLFGFLLGIAAGAFLCRICCRSGAPATAERHLRWLALLIVATVAIGFIAVPAFAWLVAWRFYWIAMVPLVALGATGFGAIFPLIAHLSVPSDNRAGAGVSHLYFANIVGSATGSLVTGLILLEHFPFKAIAAVLGLLGLLCSSALVLAFGPERSRRRWSWLAGLVVLAIGMVVSTNWLYDSLYEKLIYRTAYRPGTHFAHVVETRGGVITVDEHGTLYGGGVYDGAYSIGLDPDVNKIFRAFGIEAFHRSPKDVLVIGLGSGSWAAAIADLHSVERLTIVEINPGYLRLLPLYPPVAGLTSHPKVNIEIDDGRRWLANHPGARFDVIVASLALHWRSGAANVLSLEFLEIVRSRLKPGGVYYYNATGSGRAERTGAVAFPYAWQVDSMLAVSDRPMLMDLDALRQNLATYRVRDELLFDPSSDAGRRRLDYVVSSIGRVESRDQVLARTSGLDVITDDNMGSEWEWP